MPICIWGDSKGLVAKKGPAGGLGEKPSRLSAGHVVRYVGRGDATYAVLG